MIRGKENLIEWVKSTPNVKQIQIRTSPGADAFQFQSEEGENKKTMEDRLSRTLDYLEPGKYYIEMSDGNSRRNWYRDYFVLEDDVTAVSSQMGAVNIGGVPSDEVDRRIAAALDAQKKEFRIAELESKVKEYEEELEERERTIVILKYFEEWKIDDIADLLKENPNTVKSILYRSLKKLKIKMSREEIA